MASGRFWFDVQALDVFETLQGGMFLPNGTGVPTYVSSSSRFPSSVQPSLNEGWTVVRTAAGRFTVTMSQSIGSIKALFAELALATPEQLSVSVSAVTTSAGGAAFEIDVINPATGALTDITAATGQAIAWKLRCAAIASQSQVN